MNLSESYRRIRSGIVAFAPKYPEKISEGADYLDCIFGTGFVVGDSLIATNAHVADEFEKMPNDGKDEIPVVAIIFTRTPGGLGIIPLFIANVCAVKGINPAGAYYGTEPPDIAIVSVKCTGLSGVALSLNTSSMSAGASIASAGFPMGSELMSDGSGVLHHLGPTLQAGIISATLPFQDVTPHLYLIDVMVQGGASGSPVFLSESGEVVGVVFARMTEKDGLPTNHTQVVPAHFVSRVIQEQGAALMKAVPRDSPSLSEIIAGMPHDPVDKITTTVHKHSEGNA